MARSRRGLGDHHADARRPGANLLTDEPDDEQRRRDAPSDLCRTFQQSLASARRHRDDGVFLPASFTPLGVP